MNTKSLKLLAHTKYVIIAFMDKELTLFAASLSFYTMFSFIPLLLVMMTFLTSLEVFSDIYLSIQKIIFENLLAVNSEVVMGYIDSFLQNSVNIGIFSTVMLFISSVFFFQNYEFIANRVFHAPQRTFIKSFGVYLLMLIITPTALGIVFFVSTNFATFMSYTEINLMPFIPYLIIWLLFFILFKFSPNVHVHFRAALTSSFILSVVFSIAKNVFVYYVFVNQSYTTIYGSFAVLIFLFYGFISRGLYLYLG